MPNSYVQYPASGSTDTFAIPFGYLDPSHLTVSIDSVGVAYTHPSESQIQIISGNPTAGAIVEIRRTTPRDSQQVVWQNASNLTETALNTSDLQFLYITQESFDVSEDALRKNESGVFSAQSLRITQTANPVDNQDVTTKTYVDTQVSTLLPIATQAEEYRDEALLARDAALAAQAAAETLYDQFDDRYLGPWATDPTVDNDGNPLTDGALYYNTTTNEPRIYDLDTTTWLAMSINTDRSVRVSDDDTSPGSLEQKLLVGGGLTRSTQNSGGDETITISPDIASQAEAEAGAASDKLMTPQRVAQAMAAAGGGGGVWGFHGTETASNQATLDITGLTGDYDWLFDLEEIRPATDNVTLSMRTSTDNGLTFDSGTSDYGHAGLRLEFGGSSAQIGASPSDNADSVLQLTGGGVGNQATEAVSGEILALNLSNASFYKRFFASLQFRNDSLQDFLQETRGVRLSTADIDAVQFHFASGNIVSGSVKIYKRARS